MAIQKPVPLVTMDCTLEYAETGLRTVRSHLCRSHRALLIKLTTFFDQPDLLMKALGCITTFSALVLALVGTFYFWPDPPPPPPLLRNADQISELAKREPVFNREVAERFPLGSPAQDLILELKRQGFAPDRLMRHEEGLSTQQIWEDRGARATYKTGRFPCGFEYTVHWRTDETRRLIAVSGTFRAICL